MAGSSLKDFECITIDFPIQDETGQVDINKIVDGIYLGSVYAANDVATLKRLGVSHVLTIDVQPLTYDLSESITYKFVYCVDVSESDLLSKFEECFKFIDEALSQGGNAVFIHCLAGVSRSATITAAYLMYRDRMCLDEALGTLKEHRPRIRPNPGFMRQLELFEKMGSNLDTSNELWRKYKLGIMADRMQAGSIDEFPTEHLLANPNDASNKNDSFFKCRKCRQALFRSSGILKHTVGQGEAAFDWRSKIPGSKLQSEDELCNRSLFIEPVQWMAESINQLDGKILCPKCHAKLGSFIWYGEKCPCGAWVAPAFHIQSSKVDEVMAKVVANQIQNKSQVISARSSDQSGLQPPVFNDSGVALLQSNDIYQNNLSGAVIKETDGMLKDSILEEIIGKKKDKD